MYHQESESLFRALLPTRVHHPVAVLTTHYLTWHIIAPHMTDLPSPLPNSPFAAAVTKLFQLAKKLPSSSTHVVLPRVINIAHPPPPSLLV